MILIFKGYNDLSYWNSIDDLLHQQKQVKKKKRERERIFTETNNNTSKSRQKKIEKDSIYCSGIFFSRIKFNIHVYINCNWSFIDTDNKRIPTFHSINFLDRELIFWTLSISHFSVSDKTASYTGLEEICIERFGNAALMFSRLSLLFYSFKLILYTCLSM